MSPWAILCAFHKWEPPGRPDTHAQLVLGTIQCKQVREKEPSRSTFTLGCLRNNCDISVDGTGNNYCVTSLDQTMQATP